MFLFECNRVHVIEMRYDRNASGGVVEYIRVACAFVRLSTIESTRIDECCFEWHKLCWPYGTLAIRLRTISAVRGCRSTIVECTCTHLD